MFKFAFLLPSFFLFFSLISAQTFEGKIKYLRLGNPPAFISTLKEVFIKGGKAKSQLYINEIKIESYSLRIGNDWYSINEISESISKEMRPIIIDSAKNIIDKLKNLKKKELILGYSCTLYKENRNTPYGKDIMFYYIADSLKADDSNISRYVKNGRIVLKSIQKINGKSYENEAIEINKMKLDDKLFELPDYPIKEVDFEKLSGKYIYKLGNE